MSAHARIEPAFEAHPAGGAFGAAPSVLDAWTNGRPFAAFADRRSAFWALARSFPTATVWLPESLGADFVEPGEAGRVRFYPMLKGFRPDFGRLEHEARFGDLVLATARFGRPPGATVEALSVFRPDLRIAEDCADTLIPPPAPVGGWRLFSAAALPGVADGGLLVNLDDEIGPPEPSAEEAMPARSLAALRDTALDSLVAG